MHLFDDRGHGKSTQKESENAQPPFIDDDNSDMDELLIWLHKQRNSTFN